MSAGPSRRRTRAPAATEKPEGGEVTVEALVGEWLAAHVDEWRPFTTRNYTSIANRYIVPQLGGLRLREVTKRRIQTFLAGLPTPSVKRYTHAVLSSVFTWASTDQDYIAHNPVRTVRRPKSKRLEAKHLEPERVKKLLHAVRGDDLEPAAVLGLLAGLRAGEACGVRWGDANLVAGELTLRRSYWGDTKSGEPRSITLTSTSVARLREHKRRQAERLLAVGVRQDDSTPIVDDGLGESLPPWRLHRQFADLAAAHGIEGYTFHALRHSHSVALLTAGVDVRTVAGRLGHSPAVLLRTYAHFIRPADAAAAERLEQFLG